MMQVDMELESSLSGDEVELEVMQRCNYDTATLPGMYKIYLNHLNQVFARWRKDDAS